MSTIQQNISQLPLEYQSRFQAFIPSYSRCLSDFEDIIQTLVSIVHKNDPVTQRQFYSMQVPQGFESTYYDFSSMAYIIGGSELSSLLDEFLTQYYPCPICLSGQCQEPCGH